MIRVLAETARSHEVIKGSIMKGSFASSHEVIKGSIMKGSFAKVSVGSFETGRRPLGRGLGLGWKKVVTAYVRSNREGTWG